MRSFYRLNKIAGWLLNSYYEYCSKSNISVIELNNNANFFRSSNSVSRGNINDFFILCFARKCHGQLTFHVAQLKK